MAPIPRDTTDRLKVAYTGPWGSHEMTFHAQAATDPADFIAGVRNVLADMVVFMWDDASFTGAELAAAGSTLFFPVLGWSPITSTSGLAPASGSDGPGLFVQFGGRGADGVRVKLYLFETAVRPNDDMRIQAAASANIESVIDALQTSGNFIGSISGQAPVWAEYANIGFNDYLVAQARS